MSPEEVKYRISMLNENMQVIKFVCPQHILVHRTEFPPAVAHFREETGFIAVVWAKRQTFVNGKLLQHGKYFFLAVHVLCKEIEREKKIPNVITISHGETQAKK